jgi:formate dehydrogenase major subunit
MKGNEVVRMVPWKDGKANEGHSCVKGRFAWGYATHKDRITKPMIRAKITDPGAKSAGTRRIAHAASEFRRIQAKYGRTRSAASPPAAAPTKRTTWCRNWCAPPSATTTSTPAPASAIRRPATAWADLWHLGRHADLQVGGAGRRDHGDRRQPDRRPSGVCLAHEAPLREGAKLIVIDPREIDLVSSPHVRADITCNSSPAPMSP